MVGHVGPGIAGRSQALAMYEDAAIWIDTNNGSTGTVVGTNGTKDNPVDNLANAVTLAAATGFRRYNIRQTGGGPLTLTSAHDDWQFHAIGEGADIALAGFDVGGSRFVRCNLEGVQNGAIIAEDCMLEDVTGMRGTYKGCRYRGTLGLFATGSVHSDGGSSHESAGGADPIFSFTGAGAHQLHLHGFAGHVELQDMTNASDEADIELISGHVTIGATNTLGTATVTGVGVVSDGAVGGTTVDVTGLVEPERLIDDVWDEALGGHTVAGSAGRAALLELYQGTIWVDTTGGGAPGAVLGTNGTPANPVDNWANALTLLAALGVSRVSLLGTIQLTGAIVGIHFIGRGTPPGDSRIDLNGFSADNCMFDRAELLGQQGGGRMFVVESLLNGVTDFAGVVLQSRITNGIGLAAGGAQLLECVNGNTIGDLVVSFPTGAACALLVHDFSGGLELSGMDFATHLADVTLIGDRFTLGASNTAGTVAAAGVANVFDASAGTTVDVTAVLPSASATAAWSEPVPGAFGAGTAGFVLGTNLDATVSSRATQVSLDDFVGLRKLLDVTMAAGSTANEIRTAQTEADGFWDNVTILVEENGTGNLIPRRAGAYTLLNGAFYPTEPLPFTPTTGDRFVIIGNVQSDLGEVV
jgi:hypothetical protein